MYDNPIAEKYSSVLRSLTHARSKLNSRQTWGSFENLSVLFDITEWHSPNLLIDGVKIQLHEGYRNGFYEKNIQDDNFLPSFHFTAIFRRNVQLHMFYCYIRMSTKASLQLSCAVVITAYYVYIQRDSISATQYLLHHLKLLGRMQQRLQRFIG